MQHTGFRRNWTFPLSCKVLANFDFSQIRIETTLQLSHTSMSGLHPNLFEMVYVRKLIILIRWCIGLLMVTFGFLFIVEFTTAALVFLGLGLVMLYYADVKRSLSRILK